MSDESDTRNGPGRPERFTPEQVIEALRSNGGFQSRAAESLNCHRRTVAEYIKRYPEIREALTEIEESFLDVAESTAMRLVRQGHPGMTIFYLKTKGKRRGYTEKIQAEVTGANGGAVRVDSWSQLLADTQQRDTEEDQDAESLDGSSTCDDPTWTH